jgi:class 3 adenylate cyclase
VLTRKSFDTPDNVRDLGRGIGGFIDMGRGLAIGRAVLEPGWRWSVDIRPIVGTTSCQVHHIQMIVSGRMAVRMDDGRELEVGPNDLLDVPPGHDTWVVGDERLVILEFSGNSENFALPTPRARAVLTMLMTDIVNSTQTAAAVGDTEWKVRLAEHNRIVRRVLERFGGREVDTTGDGFLAAFTSAEAALRGALAIQDAMKAAALEIRAGVHTGEVDQVEGGDLRGIAVHETARIMAAAPAGSVYCSALARALAAASPLAFTSVGSHPLKGFETPVELFLVAPG